MAPTTPHLHRARTPIPVNHRIILAAAGLFLLVGVWQAATIANLYLHGEKVTGTVQTSTRKSGASADVTFVTKEGKTVTHWVNAVNVVAKGDPIELVYDPRKPSRVQAAASMPKAVYFAAAFCFGPSSIALYTLRAFRSAARS